MTVMDFESAASASSAIPAWGLNDWRHQTNSRYEALQPQADLPGCNLPTDRSG